MKSKRPEKTLMGDGNENITGMLKSDTMTINENELDVIQYDATSTESLCRDVAVSIQAIASAQRPYHVV